MFGWWRLGSPSSSSRSGLSFPPLPLFCSGCPISLSHLLSPDDGPERRVCYSVRRRKSIILTRLALRRQAPPNITSSARYLKGGGDKRQIRACLSFPKVGAGRRSLFDERKTRILRSGDAELFTRISRGLMFRWCYRLLRKCYEAVRRGGELGWPFLPGLLLGDPGLNDK